MSRDLDSGIDSASADDEVLLAEFRELWKAASELWDRHEDSPAYSRYVSADYEAVSKSLLRMRGRAVTFLEWGSGLGVATIMASRLGFEAYGIEAETELVETSEVLAETYGPEARFAQGSFVPDEFVWSPSEDDEVNRTIIDIPAAYGELDMELRDFDLVYAYPWPNEHTLYHSIMRQFARKDALLISYDALEGMQLVSFHN